MTVYFTALFIALNDVIMSLVLLAVDESYAVLLCGLFGLVATK